MGTGADAAQAALLAGPLAWPLPSTLGRSNDGEREFITRMKATIDIPGLEFRVGVPRLIVETQKVEVPIEAKVVSWPKLLWHVVRTEYKVKWYQWPYVYYVIVKATVSKCLLARLRRLLRQLWAGSVALTCPECYAGGKWEAGACEGCKAEGSCRETVLLP